jgi:hypothetical protein
MFEQKLSKYFQKFIDVVSSKNGEWKIAIDRPGSGNTKNIGSINKIDELKNGKGPFSNYKNGEKIFSDYWVNYLTGEMAKSISLEKPHYSNLKEYTKYKNI